MNKTEKLIAGLLLANIALAGALHFLSPSSPVASVAETSSVVHPPDAVAPPAPETPADRMPFAPASNSMEQFREWARQDSDAALAWAMGHPGSEHQAEMVETVYYQIAQDDPARAVMLADNQHLTGPATLANLGQQWAQKDLRAATDWVLKKPAGEVKDDLLARICFVWAVTDPESAANFAIRQIPPGPAQTEAAISILHQWALRDFSGAKSWVGLFPDGEIRDRALNELAGIDRYARTTRMPPAK